MIKKILLLTSMALSLSAQSIYVGAGPGAFSDVPHAGIGVTVGKCNASGTDCGLVSYFGRFNIQDLFQLKTKTPEIVYSTNVNWRHVVASTSWGVGQQSKVELFSLGSGGVSANQTATGLEGAMGGGITYHPAKYPNWGLTFAAQGDYSPVNPGWRPNLFWQAGYNFPMK